MHIQVSFDHCARSESRDGISKAHLTLMKGGDVQSIRISKKLAQILTEKWNVVCEG